MGPMGNREFLGLHLCCKPHAFLCVSTAHFLLSPDAGPSFPGFFKTGLRDVAGKTFGLLQFATSYQA